MNDSPTSKQIVAQLRAAKVPNGDQRLLIADTIERLQQDNERQANLIASLLQQAGRAPDDEPPANPMGRDADWILAIGHALGLDSGYNVPIVPRPEVFRELFDEVRRRAADEPSVRIAELERQVELWKETCQCKHCLGIAEPPKACTHPWEHVGINADGIYWCTECFAQLRVPSITDEDQRRVLPPLTKAGSSQPTSQQVGRDLPTDETSGEPQRCRWCTGFVRRSLMGGFICDACGRAQ